MKKVLLEISQNSQVFSCEFCEISKNTFFYRTPVVAASGQVKVTCQPIYSNIFRMFNYINKRMRTAVVVAVAAKIDNKKVIYDGAFLRK